ncbi:hypothetical protein VTJ04DRAFT_2112 [Mycothermus thermophilus]|uniref:uncharacterized protein n=1 Tax=Humicola insolens TaxID=85995 RepID=UPI003743F916
MANLVRQRILQPKWTQLRNTLKSQGVEIKAPASVSSASASKGSTPDVPKAKFPSQISAAGFGPGFFKDWTPPTLPSSSAPSAPALDPEPLEGQSDPSSPKGGLIGASLGLDWQKNSPIGGNASFATIHNEHALKESSLMDNCGSSHIVNDINRLDPESIKQTGDDPDAIVEAGTTAFQIEAIGTWTLKGALDGPDGKGTVDLVLKDVAYIDGFHTNIISECRLAKEGVWFCGYDATLRYGDMEDSIILKQLIRHRNVVIFEYKPLSR